MLSFGTAGCNLACRFCQNWDISKSRETHRLTSSASPSAIAEAAHSQGCKSVAFTYNDPIIFHEYAQDIAAACAAQDIKSIAVTAGYINALARPAFFAGMDAVNLDLKSFNPAFYKKICGGELSNILDTLLFLVHESNAWVEITTLLIPNGNDSDAEINDMCKWLVQQIGADVPIHFTAFHPDWKMRDRPRTPHETLIRAHDIARSYGIKHVFVGNVHDENRSSSYCANCNTRVIGRDWHRITHWNLDFNGRCLNCRTSLAGKIIGPPGLYQGGQRRLKVGANA